MGRTLESGGRKDGKVGYSRLSRRCLAGLSRLEVSGRACAGRLTPQRELESRLNIKMQHPGDLGQASISGPKCHASQRCRNQKVSVNPADSAAHQTVPLNERQHLIVASHWHMRQALKQGQHFSAAVQRAARQFTNDEWVRFHFSPVEQITERRVAPTKVIHPDRRINQHDRGQHAAGAGGSFERLARFRLGPPGVGRSRAR